MSLLHIFDTWWLRFQNSYANGIIKCPLSWGFDKEATGFITEDFEDSSREDN